MGLYAQFRPNIDLQFEIYRLMHPMGKNGYRAPSLHAISMFFQSPYLETSFISLKVDLLIGRQSWHLKLVIVVT